MTDKTENTLPVEQCTPAQLVWDVIARFELENGELAGSLFTSGNDKVNLCNRIAAALASHPPSDERKAIVAWLRRYADGSGWVHGKTPGAAWWNALTEAADAIERGDHSHGG